MHWLYYLILALPVAGQGLLGGFHIGERCVRWYRISSFEGGSGYFVLGLALAGGVVGLVTGLVTAGILAPRTGVEHLRTLGVAVAGVLALWGMLLGICWSLADIPPDIRGRTLTLEVELRLPVGAAMPVETAGDTWMELHSVTGDRVRRSERGTLELARARLEQGRWIVPGSVSLFTTRGKRAVGFQMDGARLPGFQVPVPGRPGPSLLEWSGWLPQPPASHPPWPDSQPSYRFRLQPEPEPEPPPSAQAIQADRIRKQRATFDAMKPDSSVAEWMAFACSIQDEELRVLVIERMTARPTFAAEIEALMLGEDADAAGEALRWIGRMSEPSPEWVEPVVRVGRDIARRLRQGIQRTVEEDPSYHWAAEISIRFSAWHDTVSKLREKCGGDFTRELGAILELSRLRPDSQALRSDVCRVASFYMKEWAGVEPLPDDPKPR